MEAKVMQTQLKVIKADGSTEEYLYTKVMGTINNALTEIGQTDVYIAEQFADVVTYFLYNQQENRTTTSNEIFSMIKAILSETGYVDAAEALSQHHFVRMLKRSRTEVITIDIQELTDAEMITGTDNKSQWEKSRIVHFLVREHNFGQQTARTIASMVEDRIFNMEITRIPTSLIKQLVLRESATFLQAQRQLQTV
jgi:transcriptional regulator NrdR family protein